MVVDNLVDSFIEVAQVPRNCPGCGEHIDPALLHACGSVLIEVQLSGGMNDTLPTLEQLAASHIVATAPMNEWRELQYLTTEMQRLSNLILEKFEALRDEMESQCKTMT